MQQKSQPQTVTMASTAIVKREVKSDICHFLNDAYKQCIANRRTVTDVVLQDTIVGCFDGIKSISLGMLKPLILEVERRFKNNRNKKDAVGKLWTFGGCTGMKTWCPKHLGYSYRQVRRMLDFKLQPDSTGRAPWSTKTADGTDVLEAFSTIQKDIRRSAACGDIYERRAIYFTKQLYAIKWEIWKRLLILASEDIGCADLSVSREVEHLSEVAKTVKDAKHSDLLMLIQAVAICCRAKKSRAIDNAVHFDPTFKPMTDAEAIAVAADTTVYTVPEFAHDGLHTGIGNGTKAEFLINEDAALGNRSDVGEIVSADYRRGYDDGFADGAASVPTPPPIKPKPTKRSSRPKAQANAWKGCRAAVKEAKAKEKAGKVSAEKAAGPEKSSVAALVTVVTARPGCICKHNGSDYEITGVSADGMSADLKCLRNGSHMPSIPVAELRFIRDLDAEAVL